MEISDWYVGKLFHMIHVVCSIVSTFTMLRLFGIYIITCDIYIATKQLLQIDKTFI